MLCLQWELWESLHILKHILMHKKFICFLFTPTHTRQLKPEKISFFSFCKTRRQDKIFTTNFFLLCCVDLYRHLAELWVSWFSWKEKCVFRRVSLQWKHFYAFLFMLGYEKCLCISKSSDAFNFICVEILWLLVAWDGGGGQRGDSWEMVADLFGSCSLIGNWI
jgi:hypothetical protein